MEEIFDPRVTEGHLRKCWWSPTIGQFSTVVKHTGSAVELKCLGSSGLSATYQLCDCAANKHYLSHDSCEDAMSLCTSSTQKIIWHIKSNRRLNILVHTRTYDNTTVFIYFPEFSFLPPTHSSPLKVSSSSSALPPPCINILFLFGAYPWT